MKLSILARGSESVKVVNNRRQEIKSIFTENQKRREVYILNMKSNGVCNFRLQFVF